MNRILTKREAFETKRDAFESADHDGPSVTRQLSVTERAAENASSAERICDMLRDLRLRMFGEGEESSSQPKPGQVPNLEASLYFCGSALNLAEDQLQGLLNRF